MIASDVVRRIRHGVVFSFLWLLTGFDWPVVGDTTTWQQRSFEERSSMLHTAVGSSDPTARALWLRALGESNLREQLEIAQLVSERGVTEAVPVLVRWLDAPNPELRRVAVTTLASVRSTDSLPSLMRSLSDADMSVRSEAVRAVASLGHAAGVVSLLERLSDSEALIRTQTASVLGEIGDSRAVFTLLGTLQDSVPEVRVAALVALGQIADPRALRGVVAAFHDTTPSVRIAAIEATGILGDVAPEAVSDLASVALRESREWDPSGQSRLATVAVQALGRIASHEAMDVLIEIIHRGLEFSDRAPVREAFRVLKSLGTRCQPRVDVLVSQTPGEFSDELVVLLGTIGGDDAAVYLLSVLEHRTMTPSLRARVLFALGQTGSSHALLPLLTEAERTDTVIVDRECPVHGVDPAALHGLSQLVATHRIPQALDVLLALRERSAGSCERTQAELIQLIGSTGNPRAIVVLSHALASPSPSMRLVAASAFQQAGIVGAERALVNALSDPSREVRQRCADALAHHGNTAALDALLTRFDSSDALDRVAAVRTMGHTAARLPLNAPGVSRAVATLVSCAESDRDVLSAACLDALADSSAKGNVPALHALIRAVQSSQISRARAAMEAIVNAVTLASNEQKTTILTQLDGALAQRGDHEFALERAWAHADPGDLDAVLREPATGVATNTLAGIGRMNDTVTLSPQQARALWEILRRNGSASLRANVAMLLARTSSVADDASVVIRLLRERGSVVVRIAAARLAVALAARSRELASQLRAAIRDCASRDVSEVAAVCEATSDVSAGDSVDARVLRRTGASAEGSEMDLVLPSGWVRVATVGIDGWVHERAAGHGMFRVVLR
jgi:HEAT repeat protein